MKNFIINLEEWIILDENYRDFKINEIREFALRIEFERLSKSTRNKKSLGSINSIEYSGTGEVVFKSEEFLVIDFGILVYCYYDQFHTIRVGDYLTGTFSIGIDPFDYFEYWNEVKGIPPIVYSWKIEDIMEETYDYIEIEKNPGKFQFVQDQSSGYVRTVESTDILSKNVFTNFRLYCSLQLRKPSYIPS